VLNTIGPFSFITLSAPVSLAGVELALYTRAGTDGTLIADLGRRGESFSVDSLAGVANYPRAWQLALEYKALEGADPVQVIWSDFLLTAARHAFFVLDVQPLDVRRIIRGHGPAGAYYAELEARWQLLPVFF
jgi:hypothetical protein